MITPIKTLFATLGAGVVAVSVATPAMANHVYGHDRGGWDRSNARSAINACSRVAERLASRHGYERANVRDIRDVRDTRWGYEVRGRIAVRDFDGGRYDGYRGRNDRGWNDRGWNDWNRGRGRDSGSFTCRFERGRVVDLDIDGIRRL